MSSKTSKKQTTTTTVNQTKQVPKFDFAFGKQNYILLVVGIVVLAIGYILLIGGGSDDPTVFNYAIFDTQRLIIAPIVLLAGFVIEIFAIMKKPKD